MYRPDHIANNWASLTYSAELPGYKDMGLSQIDKFCSANFRQHLFLTDLLILI